MGYLLETPLPHRDNVPPNAVDVDVEVVIRTSDQTQIGPITISYFDFMCLEFALTQTEGLWEARDLTPSYILPASQQPVVSIRASAIVSFNYTTNSNPEEKVNIDAPVTKAYRSSGGGF